MAKRITIPKVIYDRYIQDVKNGIAINLLNIRDITDPYLGQLGIDDNNICYMYKNEHWIEVKWPEAINPAGCYKFGDFRCYYLYWINYRHPEYYSGSYMMTTVPFMVLDERLISGDDDKIHDVICEFATKVVRSGGEIVFTETASEAGMQAVIKSEQYKYAMIESIVKQFENVGVEFVPEEVEKDEA